MNPHPVVLRDGTAAVLYQADSGLWACPVCGSVELVSAPYRGDGAASFEVCSCGFEFGYDDDPGASAEADPSVQANWVRWRRRYLDTLRSDSEALAQALSRLQAIGVREAGEGAL